MIVTATICVRNVEHGETMPMQNKVHQKAAHAPVPVAERVDGDEFEMDASRQLDWMEFVFAFGIPAEKFIQQDGDFDRAWWKEFAI